MQHSFLTVRDLLRYAVTRFSQAHLSFGHGNTNAYDEAAYLVLYTLHLPLDTLDPFLDARLLYSEISAVLDIIERRVTERLPAAYLTQEAWLHGYCFYVDNRVIIPRSLISGLLLERLWPWVNAPDALTSVLDLCTGSGCLAIMAADAFPCAKIDAIDLSTHALQVAQRNIDNYNLHKRIMLLAGNLFEPLTPRRYNLIISNPPYVNDESMKNLTAEYCHEPKIALSGGRDGMDIVRQIIDVARNWLTNDGLLVIEIGNERNYVEDMFGEFPLTWLPTDAGNDSVFLLRAEDLPLRKT
ncbi:50S ribosomal protein L3 N(5)-glutamine methyltransferase [Candidatus Vallotia cooleyia]|uniref:50S ribosomal protein L3 N(5)-glutamine methyltransferase n=1 Tax=Candidatus Vallotiella adelgis TaxID=1177211 RepID=UPI001D0199B8|nr:50S ribosomal protein L3 N(5)-glutamine methyltransferase [Candidatus Vallotia cooleyia]UDG81911.1 50S ribosomal protein L3 glutamine methyltransferase [Candidatus Vallotia cooleyia]